MLSSKNMFSDVPCSFVAGQWSVVKVMVDRAQVMDLWWTGQRMGLGENPCQRKEITFFDRKRLIS